MQNNIISTQHNMGMELSMDNKNKTYYSYTTKLGIPCYILQRQSRQCVKKDSMNYRLL